LQLAGDIIHAASWTTGVTFFTSSEETKGLAESWTQISSESPSISCKQTTHKISTIFMQSSRRSNRYKQFATDLKSIEN